MPNWIIHIGSSYAIGRIFRIKDIYLFLLGAILPDLSIPFRLFFIDFLSFQSKYLDAYFESLHTPFCLCFLAITIALFTQSFYKSTAVILIGAILHLFMDIFQIGRGVYFFYPFNFTRFNFNIYDNQSWYAIILTLLFLILLIIILIREGKTAIYFHKPNKQKKFAIFSLLMVILIFPLFTIKSFLNNPDSLYYVLNHPEDYKEKLLIPYAKVICENPLRVRKWEDDIYVKSNIQLTQGDIVTLLGSFKNNYIRVKWIYKHNIFLKTSFSCIGAIFLFLIIFGNTQKFRKIFQTLHRFF